MCQGLLKSSGFANHWVRGANTGPDTKLGTSGFWPSLQFTLHTSQQNPELQHCLLFLART